VCPTFWPGHHFGGLVDPFFGPDHVANSKASQFRKRPALKSIDMELRPITAWPGRDLVLLGAPARPGRLCRRGATPLGDPPAATPYLDLCLGSSRLAPSPTLFRSSSENSKTFSPVVPCLTHHLPWEHLHGMSHDTLFKVFALSGQLPDLNCELYVIVSATGMSASQDTSYISTSPVDLKRLEPAS
jgi:hypothetical protein